MFVRNTVAAGMAAIIMVLASGCGPKNYENPLTEQLRGQTQAEQNARMDCEGEVSSLANTLQYTGVQLQACKENLKTCQNHAAAAPAGPVPRVEPAMVEMDPNRLINAINACQRSMPRNASGVKVRISAAGDISFVKGDAILCVVPGGI